jgi:hypothetical protein
LVDLAVTGHRPLGLAAIQLVVLELWKAVRAQAMHHSTTAQDSIFGLVNIPLFLFLL